MNKKIIALAIAAALAPAAAMADSGNVVIYGQANASVDYANPGTGAASLNDKAWRVSSNSSRLGFKGTEDVGNGLSAIWQMETGVSLDSGSTSSDFMLRNSFVGLSSKAAGTVLFGKHDTPYKLGTGSLDMFADTMGDYNAIVGNIDGTVAFDSRLGNVAAYISPTWAGFHFAGASAMANETNNTARRDGRAYSLTGIYNNGPMFGSLSYEQAKDITVGSSTNLASPGMVAILATLEKATGTKLGLGYKFGPAAVGFIAERIKLDVMGDSIARNAFYVNGSYTLGSNVIKAAFGKAGSTSGSSDDGAKQLVIGADHNLSKRTAVYALYSKMKNDNGGDYGLGGNGAGGAFSPAASGQDPSVLSLGVKHNF